MNFSEKKKQVKNWLKLVMLSRERDYRIWILRTELSSITNKLFPEKIQKTKGFFIPKPLEYIVPTDWGKTDPCIVTIYRKAHYSGVDDLIINTGTDADVKEFKCPCFKEDTPCNNPECRFKKENNRYFALPDLIAIAEKKGAATYSLRAAAWKELTTFQK